MLPESLQRSIGSAASSSVRSPSALFQRATRCRPALRRRRGRRRTPPKLGRAAPDPIARTSGLAVACATSDSRMTVATPPPFCPASLGKNGANPVEQDAIGANGGPSCLAAWFTCCAAKRARGRSARLRNCALSKAAPLRRPMRARALREVPARSASRVDGQTRNTVRSVARNASETPLWVLIWLNERLDRLEQFLPVAMFPLEIRVLPVDQSGPLSGGGSDSLLIWLNEGLDG